VIRATAGQTIGAQLVNATTGAAFAGTVTVYVTLDAGTQAIGTVGSGLATLEGQGYYTYRPTAAETDAVLIGFTFTGTGAVPATVQVFTITAAVAAALSAPASAGTATGLSVCRAAAIAIGHLDPLETLSDGDAAFILGVLNGLVDDWNADREAVYANVFTTYSTVAAQTPTTIGPTGTFVTAQRPVTIDGAALILTGGIRVPITVGRDAAWWFDRSVPALAAGIPTDLYYDATWPNGSLYFYPVPNAIVAIELMTRLVLASMALATTFTLPPGYLNAVTLTVAEAIAAPLGITLASKLEQRAAQARERIGRNNRQPTPKLRTRDRGIPSGSHGGLSYNFLTGGWS